MLNLYWKLRSLTTRQEGQGMVEYALILVLVSIVVIVIVLTMGHQIQKVFSTVVAPHGKHNPTRTPDGEGPGRAPPLLDRSARTGDDLSSRRYNGTAL